MNKLPDPGRIIILKNAPSTWFYWYLLLNTPLRVRATESITIIHCDVCLYRINTFLASASPSYCIRNGLWFAPKTWEYYDE
jgi:hypothetical protein